MKISVITVFPELYDAFLDTSLISRAIGNEIVSFNLVRLSDLCEPKARIDEPVCGPGTGMIIKPELIEKSVDRCEAEFGSGFKIFFSPQGRTMTQPLLKRFQSLVLSGGVINPQTFLPAFIDLDKNVGSYRYQRGDVSSPVNHLILICSRYEGIDARVEEHYADAVLSIGDYVLMGGDIPAQVFLEGFLRLIPGVVGKQESVEDESFSSPFLDYPEYGLPAVWKGEPVPEVVTSGNHAQIDRWRKEKACEKTVFGRFDWLRSCDLTSEERDLCSAKIPSHYVVLMHTDIVLKGGEVGNSSITSLDLHDTARSCTTYGIKNMFMVSPLKDQTAIMNDLLGFWKSDAGKKYNETRFDAISRVIPAVSLQEVLDFIEKREGKRPLIITTSAKEHAHGAKIDYYSQGLVWKQERPILFVFGTAQGLADYVIDQSDFLLLPIKGLTGYTHLSVRSAVAIILDRWFGLNRRMV